jgi:hypothetical protein
VRLTANPNLQLIVLLAVFLTGVVMLSMQVKLADVVVTQGMAALFTITQVGGFNGTRKSEDQ